MDLLVTSNQGPAVLLSNRAGSHGNWIRLRLASRNGGRDAVGARVRVSAGDMHLSAEVRAGSSYLSHEDPRLHFGIGRRELIDELEIRWPEGDIQRVPGRAVPVNRTTTIDQPPAGETGR